MQLEIVNPLAPPPPRNRELPEFLRHFQIQAAEGLPLLTATATAFARLPYENLSKIVKHEQEGTIVAARRSPPEVLHDHFLLGTGGTCFSLTAALLFLVRSLGWRAEPILADRRYGANTHCALLVWINNIPHLLDPGYLLVQPVPIPTDGEIRIATEFNEIILKAGAGPRRVELLTHQQGHTHARLTFKTDPADPEEFIRAWDESFDWEMMCYPLITSVQQGQQRYLQGNRYQTRSRDGVFREEIDPALLVQRIGAEFGIAPLVISQALAILTRKGEKPHGRPAVT